MRKFTTMLAAAALAVAFASTADAQNRQRGGGQGQPGQGRGMGGGFGGGSVYMLLSTNETLQKELKITDEQKTKLTDVAKEQGAKMREAFQGGGGFNPNATDEERKERAEKMAKLTAESKKAYEAVLTPEQAKRTTQINYQYMGVRAFSDKDVQTTLKMSDDQKEKIKTVMDQYNKDVRELGGGFGGRGGAGRGQPQSEEDKKKAEENTKKREALTKETEEKIVATLSDDQKTSWKTMIGEKFDVAKLRVAQTRPRDN